MLPDRKSLLREVYERCTHTEGISSMCCGNGGYERSLANQDRSYPMDNGNGNHRGIGGDLGGHGVKDVLRRGMCLVGQFRDVTTMVVVSDDPFKGDNCACTGVPDGTRNQAHVEGFMRDERDAYLSHAWIVLPMQGGTRLSRSG